MLISLPFITDSKPAKLVRTSQPDLSYESAPPVSAQPGKRPKVLIIDDSEAVVEMVRNNLHSAGYKVVSHTKSLGTMIAVMDERPDLILLDVKMPLLDAAMLCRLIKRNQLISKTPILLYSSLNEKQLGKKVAECEAQGYIHKSWGIKRVIKKVSEYLTPASV